MSSQRRPAKAQLRRSLSEQLRDSTAKAWDLLWRNVRERRLAGQSRRAAAAGTCLRPPEGRARGTSRPRRCRGLPAARGRPGGRPGRLGGTCPAASAAPERGDLGAAAATGPGAPGHRLGCRHGCRWQRPGRSRCRARSGVQTGQNHPSPVQAAPARVLEGTEGMVPQTAALRAKSGVAPRRRHLLSISEIKRVDFASGKQTYLLVFSKFSKSFAGPVWFLDRICI